MCFHTYSAITPVCFRESVLEVDVVVGENSEIGEQTYVTQSVIGKRCKIGNNVRISNAYIWDDVIIEVKQNKVSIVESRNIQIAIYN